MLLQMAIFHSFLWLSTVPLWGFSGSSVVKSLPAMLETWVNLLVGKIPWRREWQPIPIFLSGKSHGQRSLAGYSPWGHKRVGYDLSDWAHMRYPIIYIIVCLFPPMGRELQEGRGHGLSSFAGFPVPKTVPCIEWALSIYLLDIWVRGGREFASIPHALK